MGENTAFPENFDSGRSDRLDMERFSDSVSTEDCTEAGQADRFL